jgi:methyltransferase-like protein/ubiquinone/menaquinone biosynthesis C-methylase UbiE
MKAAELTSYDEVPYHSYPFPQTHPDRLATIAILFGMEPAPVRCCRVLELGCASGGNLVPMALGLPGSRFVGIDASHRQVAEGRRLVESLGLKNIELVHSDILNLDAAIGPFDYIICHGVYSWVSCHVQNKILDLCASCLGPNGVAYVSYNTYPGWHMHGMIRDMMCYHTVGIADPNTRVAQARALLNFLATAAPQRRDAYGLLLDQELKSIQRKSDDYLFHEFLEAINDPIYFYQFAQRADEKGLQYLGEANIHVMLATHWPPHVESVLRRLSVDLIHLQQYLDFLRNTPFRQSLLCHDTVELNRGRRPDCLERLYVASPAKPPSSAIDFSPDVVEHFQGPGGKLSTSQPLLKAAMVYLSEVWPKALSFGALRDESRSRLAFPTAPDASALARDTLTLATSLLNGYLSTELVELHTHAPEFALEVTERPVGSLLARLQAARSNRVTNLRHEVIDLTPFEQAVLHHLDGNHNRRSLLTVATNLLRAGTLHVTAGRALGQSPHQITSSLEDLLDRTLCHLAQSALLAA